MADLVERIWDGPFDALLPNLTTLRRGERHLVTLEDAKSAHWKDPSATREITPAPSAPAATPTSTPKVATD